ncbi:MAG: hypothetical protein OXC62_01390 [Aestuariivita sp.]|nr:hypothetical protein [Aestuariivita sp.]
MNLTFMTALFLIFLVLKLTEIITWSWWWVTAPIWLPPAIISPIFALIIFVIKKETDIKKICKGLQKLTRRQRGHEPDH